MLVPIRRTNSTPHFQIAAVPSLGGGQNDGKVSLLTHHIQSKIVTTEQEGEQAEAEQGQAQDRCGLVIVMVIFSIKFNLKN